MCPVIEREAVGAGISEHSKLMFTMHLAQAPHQASRKSPQSIRRWCLTRFIRCNLHLDPFPQFLQSPFYLFSIASCFACEFAQCEVRLLQIA